MFAQPTIARSFRLPPSVSGGGFWRRQNAIGAWGVVLATVCLMTCLYLMALLATHEQRRLQRQLMAPKRFFSSAAEAERLREPTAPPDSTAVTCAKFTGRSVLAVLVIVFMVINVFSAYQVVDLALRQHDLGAPGALVWRAGGRATHVWCTGVGERLRMYEGRRRLRRMFCASKYITLRSRLRIRSSSGE